MPETANTSPVPVPWTLDEDRTLIRLWAESLTLRQIARRIPSRTLSACVHRAATLRLPRREKFWKNGAVTEPERVEAPPEDDFGPYVPTPGELRRDAEDDRSIAVYLAADGRTDIEVVNALPYPADDTRAVLAEHVRRGLLAYRDDRYVRLSDHESKARNRGQRLAPSARSPKLMPKKGPSQRRAMEAA